MPRGPPNRGHAKSDLEGSKTLPILHGALIFVYNGVVRRKNQYTTLKWNFLHRGDYTAGRFWTCSAKVPFRGNGPDSCRNLASCWVGNVPMTYYNLNKVKSHMELP